MGISGTRFAVLVGGAVLVLSAAPVSAESPSGPDRAAAAKGETAYRRYCAACHGAAGKGDGPIASELRTPPSDLTRLGGKTGKFSFDKVASQIDGRETIRAHGTTDMPAWGDVFPKTKGTNATTVEDAVGQIVHFLWSIQRK
ncbi:MAG TPA: cytochrome c [Vicinamibacteria bacterium]|nr:cytochrome c [Vicinamibacteria bacterium]